MYQASFMNLALDEANKSLELDEVPVGSVLVLNNKIIGRGHNQVIVSNSPIKHAEIIAIEDACQKTNNFRLLGADIYTTLEPCHMCAKAIVDARISNVYYGAYEPKTGAVCSVDRFFEKKHLNHKVNAYGGFQKLKSEKMLKKFFKSKRL